MKTKICILITVILVFIVSFGFCQDIIVKTNGDEIKAKVVEIGFDAIKYRTFENPEGPVYNIAKTDVFMIKYANGSKDVISNNTNKNQQEVKNQPVITNQTGSPIKMEGKKYYTNDKKIGKLEVLNILKRTNNTDIYKDFSRGLRKTSSAHRLIIIGGVISVAGVASIIGAVVTGFEVGGGIIFLIAGGGIETLGLTKNAKAKKIKARAINDYNSRLSQSK